MPCHISLTLVTPSASWGASISQSSSNALTAQEPVTDNWLVLVPANAYLCASWVSQHISPCRHVHAAQEYVGACICSHALSIPSFVNASDACKVGGCYLLCKTQIGCTLHLCHGVMASVTVYIAATLFVIPSSCAYALQVKSGNDDMRQDAVMQQFFELVNSVLQQNPDTHKRKLRIATYKVSIFIR